MEFPHEGESIYYRHQATYIRDIFGDLLYCTGPQATRIREHWYSISVHFDASADREPARHAHLKHAQLNGDVSDLQVYELHSSTESAILTGIVLTKLPEPTSDKKVFESTFVHMILDQANLAFEYQFTRQTPHVCFDETAEKVSALFDRFLRYQGKNDKWIDCGRTYFTERVLHFVSQGKRIELCLPAFPCKSSNTDKVTGKDPDRGELLALERLHAFVQAVEHIYEPGAKLWIISDGHVFSDCIGVDDQDVDIYSLKLIKMNRTVGLRRGNPGRVGFKSLADLFGLGKAKSFSKRTQVAKLNMPGINHYVDTQLTAEAELCRRLLMAGCQSQRPALRARIESQDSDILALYRGFSRFMLEDLELHPHTRNMSRSKQKKLTAQVAFEMIMRNQAYSNLVELVFPNHVRLSIHAHNNAGPKFGIQLFDPAAVRAVESLSPDSHLMTSRDLLHIPTPWHNCVAKIVGSETLFVTKARVVRQALAAGELTGSLGAQDNRLDACGAVYFTLCTPIASASATDGGTREPAKPQEAPVESQKAMKSGEGLASLAMSPIKYLAASSTTLACDADYVFV
ncbi:Pyoverdine/dityrosine biosynthesis protein-domain-containing protein [Hypomontagnella submonticulosa]|nr:Pyoverdine/dityrosine biosynthesis protein-domain-containing protein [Hypomontagnella submonticulosa]